MQAETITEQQAIGYDFTICPVDKVINEEPLLNEELFILGGRMAKTCVVPVINCFQCMLPVRPKPKSAHRHAKRGIWIRYAKDRDGLMAKQRVAL